MQPSIPVTTIEPSTGQNSPATPDYPKRRSDALDSVRASLGEADALLLTDRFDIHYLTGIRDGISWLVLRDADPFAITRHMMIDDVARLAPDCEFLLPCARSTDDPELEEFLAAQLSARGLDSCVCDPARISAASHLDLSRRAAEKGIGIKLLDGPLTASRAVKDDWEIALTVRCVELAEQAFRDLIDGGCTALVGRTERDVANELSARMRDLGADRQGFPQTGIIVAGGPNSARPHHMPGDREIGVGEPVLIDWGAELDGYRSDSTRTLFTGKVPAFAERAYPVVREALETASRALRDGAGMGSVDQAARAIVTRAGFPEFHYGVGHGVGLQIHEAPWIRANSTGVLNTGMLTTLEPGIYLPGEGGIRIENVYRITDHGAEDLGRLPTELESMILA